MSNETKQCTLSDEELISKAEEWVSKLCKSGGREWCLRVPVDFNNDPDMLFLELTKRINEKNAWIHELNERIEAMSYGEDL